MEHVTSRANPLLARIRKLCASASYRREEGAFVCDGTKLVTEALHWGAEVEAVVCADTRQAETEALLEAAAFRTDADTLPEAEPRRTDAAQRGIRVVSVPPEVMASVSPAKTPQGILCVCRRVWPPLPERLNGRRYLLLDGVQDPGNVGTILRTADALGGDGLFLLPGCADLYHPRTLRASMGAVFRLPAWSCTAAEAGTLFRRADIPLYGAALSPDARDPRTLDSRRLAYAIGSEGRGLSAETLALCAGAVRIPMRARCESLNAAMAAGLLLWEAVRGDSAFPEDGAESCP